MTKCNYNEYTANLLSFQRPRLCLSLIYLARNVLRWYRRDFKNNIMGTMKQNSWHVNVGSQMLRICWYVCISRKNSGPEESFSICTFQNHDQSVLLWSGWHWKLELYSWDSKERPEYLNNLFMWSADCMGIHSAT